ncbi:hypothetical protein AB0M36_16705 [Actinoplanes sp. NPDC051346]|uniref:hypothetical protein n=1 Tax=Actinoplanes sp. NPDC051346 TaxID=3155048 RepID=UPI0034388812
MIEVTSGIALRPVERCGGRTARTEPLRLSFDDARGYLAEHPFADDVVHEREDEHVVTYA